MYAVDIEREDASEDAAIDEVIVASNDVVVASTKVGTDGTVASCVKMKLNQLCCNGMVKDRIQAVVMMANVVLGEAYAFSNFHVLRLVSQDKAIPAIDDKFYWRCMMAVTTNNCIARLFDVEFLESIKAFDALRTPTTSQKVDISGNFNQIAASLRVVMQTAAVNHLWLNLDKRVSRYISWRWPTLKRYAKKIQRDVTFGKNRKDTAEKCFPGIAPKAVLARQVIKELRDLLPDVSGFGTRAHLTLKLYARILKDTEVEMERRRRQQATSKKKFNGRLFNLLPMKGGFTISHVPISSMAYMMILRDCKLVDFTDDGRGQNHLKLWAKHFNLNAIETRNRKFAGMIATDGTSVSAVMTQQTGSIIKIKDLDPAKLLRVLEWGGTSVGVDPGITDVVAYATSDGKLGSYSGKRYYEDAKINLSRRRTTVWNAETEDLVRTMPTSQTCSVEAFTSFARTYLNVFRRMLAHRASKGYRNMRFMRYVFKKKTVERICDMIAPKDKPGVVVGFGNWRGPNGTPISRRCMGPLQDIKRVLNSRSNVWMVEIDEMYSSKRCCNCHCDMVNMRSKDANNMTTKVHKVLHCQKCSNNESSTRCGSTFDRDVNASKNMLMLLMCIVYGSPRPARFCRSTPKAPEAPKAPKAPST